MTANFGLNKIKDLQVKADFKKIGLRRSLLVLFVFVLVLAVLSIDFLPSQLSGIKEGKPSPKTIKANRDLQFTDFEKTEELRKEAAASVQKVYARDWTVESQSIDLVHKLFGTARQVRANVSLSPQAKFDVVSKFVGEKFNKNVINTLLTLPDQQFNELEAIIVTQLDQVYRDTINPENFERKREEFKTITANLTQNSAINEVVSEVGALYLKPNYFYDKNATDRLKQSAISDISPVVVNIQEGQIIVREGEVVNSTQVKILKELGLLKRGIDLGRLSGMALFTIISFVAYGIFLYYYQTKIYSNDRLIFVLAIIFTVSILIAKFVGPFYSFYLIPVAAAAMLTALMFNIETAIFMVVMISLFSGLIAGQNYQYILYGLLTGFFAIYSVNNIRQRPDLVLAGARVILASTILAMITTLLSGAGWLDVLKNIGWGLIGGISSSILTIGLLPFLEHVFGITTDIKLIELSYANQPLMRELMMKAPGTYNHSIMTGNLAETAAEEIGANPLLARVGAYYHDIGKTKRPLFFAENQVGVENPHDHTNPNLSCLIITSHVKEGVELAKKHKLPQEIVDIISQHHGNSVVAYFYHKAKENIIKETVCEENFRYQGQRPNSKEAALVMLADSVEAAARTITKPSPARIEQLIKRIIQSKLDDGQLNESNLTLNDLEKIIKSFTQVLSSFYHSRVEYPTLPLTQPRSIITHGNPDQ